MKKKEDFYREFSAYIQYSYIRAIEELKSVDLANTHMKYRNFVNLGVTLRAVKVLDKVDMSLDMLLDTRKNNNYKLELIASIHQLDFTDSNRLQCIVKRGISSLEVHIV